jgi:hypothetical protein
LKGMANDSEDCLQIEIALENIRNS